MYIQLILHLLGDFILQNDEVRLHKKDKNLTGLLYCIFHCITYGIVFLFITNWLGALLIAISHFLIDRWNIVGKFIKYKNGASNLKNFGYSEDRPMFMSVWLYIIQDNALHLMCNYLIIKYV